MAVENDLAIAPIAEFRINDKMQILNPNEHGLPQLPVFNESLYLNPETQTDATLQLITLMKANVAELAVLPNAFIDLESESH